MLFEDETIGWDS